MADRRGIPHHLIDIADPTDEYTAAQYARDAAGAIREVHARGGLPLVVGGTGFYYRALTRGLFPGPGKRRRAAPAARPRSPNGATSTFLHRMLRRVDPRIGAANPAARPEADRSRARSVLSDRPAADLALRGDHVADRRRGRPRDRPPPAAAVISARVTTRVDEQFERGLLDEIRGLLGAGVPETARPFGGLVYRQALEHLHGVRDEAATRALIAQENRRYARRQLIWFRKEPNLQWFDGPGDSPPDDSRPSSQLLNHRPDEIRS